MNEHFSISGQQINLRHGSYSAVIASVGASLRSLTCNGRNLVVPFDADQLRPLYRGATLAPWPNRIVHGRYSFAGTEHQLPINETARGHALHGLVGWHNWNVESQRESTTTLSTAVVPQEGYPFHVALVLVLVLDAEGLHSTLTASNLGAQPAPYGCAPHPYLTAGVGMLDDWQLLLPAATVLEVTPDTLVPTHTTSVDAHPQFDFRQSRKIGDVAIDHAFTDLLRTDDGVAQVRLEGPDGCGTVMSWGTSCPWVQIHTADRPEAQNHRIGLAVEPMTCPPDAFNSHQDLIVLPAGESHSARWTIRSL
ncbi:galactose mutarotase [Arthrobacter livingstonensis]|uniref:Galactose mutarotase n=1 Tax=Arthrobacter livingstonensis TaxID=670078 RepID=A0A2V5L8I2_9MICC|nr:aldose 1-epimerase family protein [Arthrobacter livingstonensis]PYI65953.1 galactose mutarotase [Arthrobacter livingstonensis]